MKYNLILFTALFCAFLPLTTFAGEFIGLVGIPGIEPNGDTDLNAYINALYRLSISIAALLAVIKIVAAGAKYMLTDIVPAKEDAKKDIQGALIGLLIVIGAIIILNTVNSDLTNLNFTVPVQEITQGQALERAIYDAVTADCDRPGRAAACQTLVCEGWITNGMEVRDGEDEISACRRTCFEDYGGAFDPKLYSPKSSTCRYDPVTAQKCDPNNSWNCCTDVKKQSWDRIHNLCNTQENPFELKFCGDNQPFYPTCREAEQICIASENRVLSTVTQNLGDGSLGSIACSIPVNQTVNNNDLEREVIIKSIYESSNFSELTFSEADIQNELNLPITTRIFSEILINASEMSDLTDGITPDTKFLDALATSLKDKCAEGTNVVYSAQLARNGQYNFYCTN